MFAPLRLAPLALPRGFRGVTTSQDLLTIALNHLDATEHALGDFGHFFSYQEGQEQSTVYLVTDDDMIDLGERVLSDEDDAYSHWCSDTTATELTIDHVIQAYPSATDWDAVIAEATESGAVEVLAVLAHLRSDLEAVAA